jgi:predicted SnoaL-like aldol condensation-catalyzing enzyme
MNSNSLKAAAADFLTMVASGRVNEAFEKHAAHNFRHHNPYFPDNARSLMAAMAENAARNPGKTLDIKLAVEDGDHVWIFSHVRQKPEDRGVAMVHIFRFENRRIVELWDIGQPVPETSPNELGMF